MGAVVAQLAAARSAGGPTKSVLGRLASSRLTRRVGPNVRVRRPSMWRGGHRRPRPAWLRAAHSQIAEKPISNDQGALPCQVPDNHPSS